MYLALAALTSMGLAETNLQPELMNMSFHNAMRRRSGGCVPNGQCYFGNNADQDCCSHTSVLAPVSCAGSMGCNLCKTALGKIIEQKSLLEQYDCKTLNVAEKACGSVTGTFKDMCEQAVDMACPMVQAKIKNAIDTPDLDKVICTQLGFCKAGEDESGNAGFMCEDCVKSGECTFRQAACCSKSTSWFSGSCWWKPWAPKKCN